MRAFANHLWESVEDQGGKVLATQKRQNRVSHLKKLEKKEMESWNSQSNSNF